VFPHELRWQLAAAAASGAKTSPQMMTLLNPRTLHGVNRACPLSLSPDGAYCSIHYGTELLLIRVQAVAERASATDDECGLAAIKLSQLVQVFGVSGSSRPAHLGLHRSIWHTTAELGRVNDIMLSFLVKSESGECGKWYMAGGTVLALAARWCDLCRDFNQLLEQEIAEDAEKNGREKARLD